MRKSATLLYALQSPLEVTAEFFSVFRMNEMWGARSVLSDSSGFLPSDGHKVAFLCVKKVQIRVEMLQVSCAAPRGSPRLQITPQLVK